MLRHIGANVLALRARRGLSQAELAELVEREPSYVQKIEYGTASPSITTLVRIAKALDVDIARLFGPKKAPSRRVGRPKRPKRDR